MGHEMGERQRWAWIAAGLSAIVSAGLCGMGWQWVLIAMTAVTFYYIYVDRHLPTDGAAVVMRVRYGKMGGALAAVCLLWVVLTLGWAAGLADAAFPMVEGLPGLGWILLALAAWGAEKGPAACARCCGVMCLMLMVLYGVVVVFAVPDVKVEYLSPAGDWKQIIGAAALCLTTGGVWYMPCRSSRKGPAWSMAVLLPLLGGALAAVTAGVLSPELAARKQVPLYDVAQSISLFGVVERIEALLSAAMTMGVFALMAALAGAGQALADQLKPWKRNGTVVCAAAALVMMPAQKLPVWILGAGGVFFWIAVPLLCCRRK